MFNTWSKIFPRSSSPMSQSVSSIEENKKDYLSLFNDNTAEQLKKIHEVNPICENCSSIQELQDIFLKTNDVEKAKFLIDNLKIKTNLTYKLDKSIEDGDIQMTKYFIEKNVGYSRYAKQMAIINGNYKTAFYAETFGSERNDTGIDIVHRKKTKQSVEWSECIPEEFRFY